MRQVFVLLLLASCGVTDVAPRQTVLRPGGVVTQPNAEGELPPGTLAVGDNVMMRRKGILEPRPAFEEVFSGGSGGSMSKIWPGPDNYIIVLKESTGQLLYREIDDALGFLTLQYTGLDVTLDPGKTFMTVARNRRIFTSRDFPLVADPFEFDGGSFPLRQAGLPQPSGAGVFAAAGGDWLADNNWVAYRAVFKRTLSDGYVIRSAPSNVAYFENTTGNSISTYVGAMWPSTYNLVAGTEIEFYRTKQFDSRDLIDGRFRLAATYTLESADITAGFVNTVLDNSADDALGANLYTNESEEGPSKANWMPPPSTDAVTHKKATFYTAPRAWQTASISANTLVGTLSTDYNREFGIGLRTITGTSTVGLTTITGVSASHILGVTSGQLILGGTFPDGTTVTSVTGPVAGVYTINTSAAAVGAAGTQFISDAIVVDGDRFRISTVKAFLEDLTEANYDLDNPVVVVAGDDITGDREGFSLTLANPVSGAAAFSIQATNSQNYTSIPQTSSDDPRTNRLYFSKIDQPEHVPPDNFLLVGEGTILKLWATQDALFAFCSDGIYRIDGDGDDWDVKPWNPDTILLASDAVDSIDNTIYALTTDGFVSISDAAGVQQISSPLIGNVIRERWEQFMNFTPALPYTWGVQIAADKYRKEVWLNFNDYEDEGHIQTWIWNTDTNTFFTQSTEAAFGIAYIPAVRSLVLSSDTQTAQYADDVWMEPTVVFNPVFGDDLGLLKQWIDVTLFLEDWTVTAPVIPQFEGQEYSASYNLSSAVGVFEHVVPLLRNAVHNKHCKFGFRTDVGGPAVPNWRLTGLSFRYRLASDSLRA